MHGRRTLEEALGRVEGETKGGEGPDAGEEKDELQSVRGGFDGRRVRGCGCVCACCVDGL